MSDIVREGAILIARWEAAQDGVRRCKSQLNSAECELSDATTALGKWLIPNDIKVGEKIAVWHGSDLIQAEYTETGTIITVRSRGRK